MPVMNCLWNLRRSGSIVLLAGLVASCATVDRSSSSASIERTVELFRTGTIGEFVSICSTPMLFDEEIIVRESDIRTIVTSLRESPARLSTGAPAKVESAQRYATVFGSSFETEMFHANYVPDDAVLIRLPGRGMDLVMLLGERTGEYRTILGLAVDS